MGIETACSKCGAAAGEPCRDLRAINVPTARMKNLHPGRGHVRHRHKRAEISVSPATYGELVAKMQESGILRLRDDGVLVINCVSVLIQPEPDPTPHASAENRMQTRAGRPLGL